MTVRLRAHHLLCLLTWAGKGYSPAFTAGFTAIARRIAAGEAVAVIDGPDEVCAPMLDTADCHCRRASVAGRDRRAARALSRFLDRPVRPGVVVRLDGPTLARMRAGYADGAFAGACAGCDWAELCRTIAAGGFRSALLPEPSDPPRRSTGSP